MIKHNKIKPKSKHNEIGKYYDFEGVSPINHSDSFHTLAEVNRRINQTDIEYDENIAGATDEINELNTKFRPELQDKINSEQQKIAEQNDDKVLIEFDDDGTPKIKSLRSGLMAGNVSITWEADQKCIKPKVTVNELATKDEIIAAVQNAEYAFVACKDSIEVISQVCAPLPISEPKEKEYKEPKKRNLSKKEDGFDTSDVPNYSMKDMKDVEE